MISHSNYCYVVSSKKYLLYQQPIEEVLREKSVYYSLNKKERDFWILMSTTAPINVTILKQIEHERMTFQEKLKKIQNIQKDQFVTIVSTNPKFINWLKLRFTNVLKGNYVTKPSL